MLRLNAWRCECRYIYYVNGHIQHTYKAHIAERVVLRKQVHFLNKWTHTAHIYTHIADRVALRMQIHKAQEDAGTLVRNSVQILTNSDKSVPYYLYHLIAPCIGLRELVDTYIHACIHLHTYTVQLGANSQKDSTFLRLYSKCTRALICFFEFVAGDGAQSHTRGAARYEGQGQEVPGRGQENQGAEQAASRAARQAAQSAGLHILSSTLIATLFTKRSRALTFENFCQDAAVGKLREMLATNSHKSSV